MRRSHPKNIRLWLFVLIIQGVSLAQPADTLDGVNGPPPEPIEIRLNTFVESSEVPLNGKVKYHVELSWIGDLSRIQIEPIEQPILTNLLLEGSGSSNRLEPIDDDGFRAVKTITYMFKPVEMGMAYIDGLMIRYKDTATGEEDQLQAQRVMIEVTEPLPDDSSGGVKAIIYVVLLIIFFGAIAFFVGKYLNKRRMKAEQLPETVCLPREYLTRISQDIDPKSNNLTDMTFRLSKIFREYLSKDFHIAAREAGSGEIIEQLKIKQLDESDLLKLKELFEKLDLIKFAGEPVDPAEFSNIYGTIETFLLKQIKIWEAQQEQNKPV